MGRPELIGDAHCFKVKDRCVPCASILTEVANVADAERLSKATEVQLLGSNANPPVYGLWLRRKMGGKEYICQALCYDHLGKQLQDL